MAAELHNGGLMQYFYNSSREHAKPMIGILRSIDAQQAADILESAVAIAGPGTPCGDAPNYIVATQSIPADLRDVLAGLERQLYNERDTIHLRLFQYLGNHRDQIAVPEDFWNDDGAR